MAENFRIYLLDILSILLPGGLLVLLLAQFEGLSHRYAALFPTDSSNWIAVAMFTGIAYMLGHFIFSLGARLDDLVFEPYQKVFWKDPLLKAVVIDYKDEVTGIGDRNALNAFKWSCAWLLKHEPGMYSTVERHIAESKFFRSLVVVLIAGIVIFFAKGDPWMGLACFLLVFFSLRGYLIQRRKAIDTAYQSVITASGKRFDMAASARTYAGLLKQRVWANQRGKEPGDSFRETAALIRLIFRKKTASSGNPATLEVRWFFPQPDEQIGSFFQSQGKPLSSASARTDQYLLIPGKDDISVKIREGKMEIKKREGAPQLVHLSAHCTGYSENWEKFIFRLQETNLPENAGGHWLSVKKERACISFVKNAQGEWTVPDPDCKPSAAFHAEYTRVTIGNKESYTFGLEWSGTHTEHSLPPSLEGLLQRLQLDLPFSSGYNAYLNKVIMTGNHSPGNS